MRMLGLAKFIFRINVILSIIIIILLLLSHILANARANKEIKVMVLDTGIGYNDLLRPYVQYKNSDDYEDEVGHGTHVTGIIVYGNKMQKGSINLSDAICKNVKIYSCKYYSTKWSEKSRGERIADCINFAKQNKFDYINYSGGGSSFLFHEYEAMKKYTDNGGIVVAGNDRKNIEKNPYYPASYAFPRKNANNQYEFKKIKNLIVVGNIQRNGDYGDTTSYARNIKWEVGTNIYSTYPNNGFETLTGTSQSTAAYLHRLLKEKCNKKE